MPPGTSSGVNHTTAPPSLGLGGAPETSGAGGGGIGETGNREGPKADILALDKVGLVKIQCRLGSDMSSAFRGGRRD